MIDSFFIIVKLSIYKYALSFNNKFKWHFFNLKTDKNCGMKIYIAKWLNNFHCEILSINISKSRLNRLK